MQKLKVKKLNPNATLLSRNLPNDAGLDISASDDIFIPVGMTVKIPTGIAIDVPPGYYAQIHDRSSLASKGLRTGAGVVDAGYQGELMIVLHNLNNITGYSSEKKVRGYLIQRGDRVAQLVFHRIELPEVLEVASFETSDRGLHGFGSSGR